MRAPIRRSDTAEASREALSALAGGASSVLIDLSAVPAGERGGASLERLLDGVLTDVAPIALDAGADGAEAAEALSRAVRASPSAPLAFHLDPLGVLAHEGDLSSGLETMLRAFTRVASRLAVVHPRASLFLANGGLIHEAGGEPALELAFGLTSAVAYARAITDVGLSAADAFARIVLGLAVDHRPLTGVAKLRAARRLWARVTGACGVAAPAVIEARSSRRMLTLADPWSNLVRVTEAGFAAAVGGADAIVLYPHDETAEVRDPVSARLARNASLILMEEAHLGRVSDPAAGAFAFEALTDDLVRAAWGQFTEIERAGGAAAALRSGMISEWVAASVAELRAELGDKRRRIVGVTDFRVDVPETSAAPMPGGLPPIRLETLAS